jgi:hypothetical protein
MGEENQNLMRFAVGIPPLQKMRGCATRRGEPDYPGAAFRLEKNIRLAKASLEAQVSGIAVLDVVSQAAKGLPQGVIS